MQAMTAEMIVEQIARLSPEERAKVQEQLNFLTNSAPGSRRSGRLKPMPMPDGKQELKWIAEHRREYAGQWVALDGDRLIAHRTDHSQVWAAAEADGEYLPLCIFIEEPDAPPFIGVLI